MCGEGGVGGVLFEERINYDTRGEGSVGRFRVRGLCE